MRWQVVLSDNCGTADERRRFADYIERGLALSPQSVETSDVGIIEVEGIVHAGVLGYALLGKYSELNEIDSALESAARQLKADGRISCDDMCLEAAVCLSLDPWLVDYVASCHHPELNSAERLAATLKRTS